MWETPFFDNIHGEYEVIAHDAIVAHVLRIEVVLVFVLGLYRCESVDPQSRPRAGLGNN